MTPPETDAPNDIPTAVVEALEGCSDEELRTVIHYAQQLLWEQPPLTDAIESRPGEELVRVTDHGAYDVAVVERPDETGDARGPFAYMVRWEPGVDDENGQYRWHYLGKVYGDSGGD
jgi:hypothetical protein